MLSLLATSLAAPVPAVPDEKSLGDGHLLGAMVLGAVGDKEGAIDMLHHEAHELIDEMHDSKPERQENDHHDHHDDHYHDHYHSNYGSTHQDSNEYYHSRGGRSLGAEEAENKESDTDARPVEAPAEKRSNYHVHYHAPSSGSYYGGVDSFGPPDATSCRGYDCSVQGQFCPPDAPGGGAAPSTAKAKTAWHAPHLATIRSRFRFCAGIAAPQLLQFTLMTQSLLPLAQGAGKPRSRRDDPQQINRRPRCPKGHRLRPTRAGSPRD